jgi:hypothetical protein
MARLSIPARLSTLVALSLGAAACHSWQAGDLSSGVAPAVAGEQTVRVTRRDQSREIVDAPQVESDSLTGYGRAAKRRVALALPDVARMERLRRDAGRATLTVVGSVAAFVGLNLVFSDRQQKSASSGCHSERGKSPTPPGTGAPLSGRSRFLDSAHAPHALRSE